MIAAVVVTQEELLRSAAERSFRVSRAIPLALALRKQEELRCLATLSSIDLSEGQAEMLGWLTIALLTLDDFHTPNLKAAVA